VTLKVIPLTYRTIWRILDSNEALRGSSTTDVSDPDVNPTPSGATLPELWKINFDGVYTQRFCSF